MIQASGVDAFVRAPIGKWVAAGTSVIWCHSTALCGSTAWGRPRGEDTAAVMRAFEGFRHPSFAPRFDVILDGRAIEVSLDSLQVFVEWVRRNLDELRRRVRLQVGVISDGTAGMLLSGLLPFLGNSHPFRVTRDAREAYRSMLPQGGDALFEEIEAIVGRVREQPAALCSLDAHLRAEEGRATLASAARQLGTSERTLQRVLSTHGTSFRDRQLDARFQAALALLTESNLKVEAIAARLGVSDGALAQLVRARAGTTPSELRRRRSG